MLRNKTVLKILSLIFAIALWFYVMGEVNPTTTRTISDIKVQILNVEALENEDLAIASEEDFTVDVTVEGQRSDVRSLKEKDIQATIDVFGYNEGTHSIEVAVEVPEKVEVTEIEEENISVKIEKLISEKKPIHVTLEGQVDNDIEPGNISTAPREIEVKGAESLVKKVRRVNAPVQVSDLDDEEKTVSVEPIPVDKEGTAVGGVELSSNTIEVTATLYHSKEVPLDVEVVGSVSDEYQVTDMQVPETIVIRGPKADIDRIDRVQAEDVDISDVTGTVSIPIEPDLPENVEIASESEGISVKVIIAGLSSKTFTFDRDDIEIVNLGSGLSADIADTEIKITVSGRNAILDDAVKGDVTLSIDLDGLTTGEHSVRILASSDKIFNRIVIDPNNVQVEIRDE